MFKDDDELQTQCFYFSHISTFEPRFLLDINQGMSMSKITTLVHQAIKMRFSPKKVVFYNFQGTQIVEKEDFFTMNNNEHVFVASEGE